MAGWCVYILRCGDDTLYTGMARDLAARLAAHAEGRAAKYTRARGPLCVVYRESRRSRASAARREAAIKRLSRAEKLALIARAAR
jgi:predicted GIY-YIG superfamily endonuclease